MVLKTKIKWLIILIALISMITSAMMAANITQKSDRQITSIKSNISKNETLITSLWQNVLDKENKAHNLVVYTLLSQGRDNPDLAPINDHYKQSFANQGDVQISIQDLPQILQKIDSEKETVVERVNTLFLEKQSLENEMTILTQKNAAYWNIAMFIQLLSLAVITIVRTLK